MLLPLPASSCGQLSDKKHHYGIVTKHLWMTVVYMPSFTLPILARLVSVHRGDVALTSGTHLVTTFGVGTLQDLAILLQALVFVRLLQAGRAALSAWCCGLLELRILSLAMAIALAGVYLFMTLACFVDLALVLSFVPRLNRAFVSMYMDFAGQFTSSMTDQLTPGVMLGVFVYVVAMVLWVIAVQQDKPVGSELKRPTFVVSKIVSSSTFRALCFAALASTSAFHATVTLNENANDIYTFSNAMFSLEVEDLFVTATQRSIKMQSSLRLVARPSETTNPVSNVASSDTNDTEHNATASETCTEAVQTDATSSSSALLDQLLGSNEAFEFATNPYNDAFPLWQTTHAYSGTKRFEIQLNKNAPPPTILFIQVESLRSLEVGVLGGHSKKTQFNQTVTPYFDELSKTGVLFRQHYTPSLQTSRTLLSTLFGILPGMTTASVVSTYAKSRLRFHGLPNILKCGARLAFCQTCTTWCMKNAAPVWYGAASM